MTTVPILETERLILRAPKADELETYAKCMASDRSRMAGGPASREGAQQERRHMFATGLL